MRMSLVLYFLIFRWDSLPIIQTYVKQKLGETAEPNSTNTTAKPKVEPASILSAPKDLLATSSVVSAHEGERWDPNKQLDKLKIGVISKLRQQQQKRSPTVTPEQPATISGSEDPSAKISVDDGTNP